MKCVCGKTLPLNNRYSICDACMDAGDDDQYFDEFDDDEADDFDDEPDESMDGDFDSGMASAGFGTDEDYNHWEDLDGAFEE